MRPCCCAAGRGALHPRAAVPRQLLLLLAAGRLAASCSQPTCLPAPAPAPVAQTPRSWPSTGYASARSLRTWCAASAGSTRRSGPRWGQQLACLPAPWSAPRGARPPACCCGGGRGGGSSGGSWAACCHLPVQQVAWIPPPPSCPLRLAVRAVGGAAEGLQARALRVRACAGRLPPQRVHLAALRRDGDAAQVGTGGARAGHEQGGEGKGWGRGGAGWGGGAGRGGHHCASRLCCMRSGWAACGADGAPLALPGGACPPAAAAGRFLTPNPTQPNPNLLTQPNPNPLQVHQPRPERVGQGCHPAAPRGPAVVSACWLALGLRGLRAEAVRPALLLLRPCTVPTPLGQASPGCSPPACDAP
jgi:hypothetical protein